MRSVTEVTRFESLRNETPAKRTKEAAGGISIIPAVRDGNVIQESLLTEIVAELRTHKTILRDLTKDAERCTPTARDQERLVSLLPYICATWHSLDGEHY